MRLVMSSQAIAVVKLPPGSTADWATGSPLVSITSTRHETSVICPTSSIPEEVPGPVRGPLVGVYVDEQLDFSQCGILVAMLRPLADAGIPVLTVSTYDTDWVLIEASRAAAASSVWRAAGYQVVDAAAVPEAEFGGAGAAHTTGPDEASDDGTDDASDGASAGGDPVGAKDADDADDELGDPAAGPAVVDVRERARAAGEGRP